MTEAIELNDKLVKQAINSLKHRVDDLSPFFGDVGEWLLSTHHDRWQAGQDASGSDWVDLKPATWAKKKGSKKLFERGHMLGIRGLSYEASANKLVLGMSDEKAVWHHFGTKSHLGNKKLPSRELLGFSQKDKDEIVELAKEHLTPVNNT